MWKWYDEASWTEVEFGTRLSRAADDDSVMMAASLSDSGAGNLRLRWPHHALRQLQFCNI